MYESDKDADVKKILDITDNLGYAAQVVMALVGETEEDADTLKEYAATLRDFIEGYDNVEQTYKIQDAAKDLIDFLCSFGMIAEPYRPFIQALNSNLSKSASDFIMEAIANGIEAPDGDGEFVHLCPEFADLSRAAGLGIIPLSVYPYVTELATFDITGENIGTLTLTDGVDITLYGGGKTELEITETMTGTCDTVTITVLTESGAVEKIDFENVTGAAGVKFDPIEENKKIRVVKVTNLSTTGNATDGKFRIQTKVDREITDSPV